MASQGENTKVSLDEKLSPNNVGALLQASRLRLGHDLRFVAKTLHIRFVYLEAIEAGRYDELPGAVYVMGFMRSYADFLGLDSEEVVRRSKDEIASQSVNTELVFPVPMPESSVPGGAIVLVGAIISILAYGGWYASTTKDGDLGGSISSVPEHLSIKNKDIEVESELKSVVVEQTEKIVQKEVQGTTLNDDELVELIKEPVQSEAKPSPVVKFNETTVNKLPKQDSDPLTDQVDATVNPDIKKINQEPIISDVKPTAAEETAQNSIVAPEPKIKPVAPETVEIVQETETIEDDEPRQAQVSTSAQISAENKIITENKIYGLENEDSKILVRARRNSWIQVRDNKANKLLLTQLLKTGDSYQVPNRLGLVLLTGNAGALEIIVDGKPVPDLAPPGTILKNITLDPEKLRQGAAAQ